MTPVGPPGNRIARTVRVSRGSDLFARLRVPELHAACLLAESIVPIPYGEDPAVRAEGHGKRVPAREGEGACRSPIRPKKVF